MDFFSAFSFLLVAPSDFDLEGRPLGAAFSAATFFGAFSFFTLFDLDGLVAYFLSVLAGVCLRADFGAAGYAALLATEALEAVAFEGDLEKETLTGDFLAVVALATDALATEALATEALATEALATEALATEALAADFLAVADLATEALAADFLDTEALTTEPLAADGLEAYCASTSRKEV